MATETARVFFALWPPAALADDLAGLAGQLTQLCGGKPTRTDTVHLTLAFVGEIDASRLPELAAAAQGLALPSFELTLDRLGYWPHNRIVWAGCSAPPVGLLELAATLRARVMAAGFPVDRGSAGFFPHLTLLRKAMRAPPASTLEAPQGWRCQGFVLVRSHLSASGSRYRVVQHYPFPVHAA
ncbi:RNA 2',3'-cyclic phosphodiesterase [Azonexus sp.]|uniref:RNA 2',3'-cyclic phosphodiesterase n=1 Tax=Azonexus sp. TaxID=1872668 RepID=UPI0035B33FB2